jgi:hypothetical protein
MEILRNTHSFEVLHTPLLHLGLWIRQIDEDAKKTYNLIQS